MAGRTRWSSSVADSATPWYYSPYYDPFFLRRPLPAVLTGIREDGCWARCYNGEDASMRLEVKPREAEVLHRQLLRRDRRRLRRRVPAASCPARFAHPDALSRRLSQAVHQQIYVQPTGTFRVKYDMVRLAPGEVAEPRPIEPALCRRSPDIRALNTTRRRQDRTAIRRRSADGRDHRRRISRVRRRHINMDRRPRSARSPAPARARSRFACSRATPTCSSTARSGADRFRDRERLLVSNT